MTIPENLPEILDISIKVAILIFFIVFIFVGFRLFRVLGFIAEITETASELIETIHSFFWKPMRFFQKIFSSIGNIFKSKK